MTIDTNPIADGNAAMANANAAAITADNINTTTGTTPRSGAGIPAEVTSTSTTTSSKGFVDESGAFTEGWLDRLKGFDDSKQILGQFKDIDGVFKTLVSQQRMMGKMKDAVLIPGEKATPQEWADFHHRLGVPESPEGYKTAKPTTLPEGSGWTDDIAVKVGEIAHKNGIPPKAWQSVLDEFGALEAQALAADAQKAEQEHQANLQQLAKEWGDKFEINKAKVTRLVQSVGGDINDPALASPGMVKMLERIAATLSEDKLVTSDLAATMMVGKARAMDIMKNPDNPLHKRYISGDREIATLVTDLLAKG